VSDIFQEVDEAVRHEEYLKLWKKYRVAIIALVSLIVLSVAGYEGWEYYDAKQKRENAELYAGAVQALQGEDPAAAEGALQQVIDATPGGYGVLASFRLAAEKAEAGDKEAAAAEMTALAGRSSAPQVLRDLAKLQAVLYRIDSGDPATLEGELAPMAQDGEPFSASAKELTAFLALKQGDSARALETFKALTEDPATPASIRRRATQMTAQIGE
jgi:hypothetical protein